MNAVAPDPWNDRLAATLRRYDESLLRQVATRLVKPRNQWPAEELIKRWVEIVDNPAVLDRRLGELQPAGRTVLALMGASRQPVWALGNLVELLMALGHEDGLGPLLDLLDAGLLFPETGAVTTGDQRRSDQLASFELWLGTAGTTGLMVFTLPAIALRGLQSADLRLPMEKEAEADGALGPSAICDLPSAVPLEADGLEWLLRLGVLWQQVAEAPLRRTQQGGFFKRDVERLESDPLLNAPPPDHLADVPDLGFLLAGLGELEGVIRQGDGEVKVGTLPGSWEVSRPAALASLWANLFRLRGWTPPEGWKDIEPQAGNPFPSAYLLAFLQLARLPEDSWVFPAAVEAWVVAHHPYWEGESVRPSRQRPWLETFLLGVCYPLRVVQAARTDEGTLVVRLSRTGRWLLGVGDEPPAAHTFPRTLLVQPNLEIIAYRQGLTPALVARLTRFATWKTLGAACTLQLQPETVYRALENGETFDSICLALEQHGTRAVPQTVLDSLRTWANKRDRITVFPSAALLEFNSPEELDEAMARGLPGIRLSGTLAVVPSEEQIEFRHFRLAGTRDYALPPDRCVSVEPDGVTLTVDLVRSDLMLETELPRFAELIDRSPPNGKRQYRLTAATLAAARESGLTLSTLETWFQQRAGQAITPAARLLLTAAHLPAPELRRHLVLHVQTSEVADGLMQWPRTRGLIAERLGPTALSVAAEHIELLKQRLGELGVTVEEGERGT